MPQLKQRTLFYRRVSWIDNQARNLEKILCGAHSSLPTTKERTFSYAEGEIQGLCYTHTNGTGLFVHVASYVPHQATSLVPFPSRATAKNTSPQAPPDRHNYLEGDIFFLVNGNHIVLLPSGAREAVSISYIDHILRATKNEKFTTELSIEPVANVDKVKLLHQEGVKSISLNASLYEATAEYTERTSRKMTLMNGIATEFLALFSKDSDKDLRDVTEMENLTVRVEVSFDSRKRGGDVGRKRLEKAASYIVDDADDEGFAITTGNGKKLTATEVRLNEKAKISAHGNSVMRSDAWEKLKEYMAQLEETGMLEQ